MDSNETVTIPLYKLVDGVLKKFDGSSYVEEATFEDWSFKRAEREFAEARRKFCATSSKAKSAEREFRYANHQVFIFNEDGSFQLLVYDVNDRSLIYSKNFVGLGLSKITSLAYIEAFYYQKSHHIDQNKVVARTFGTFRSEEPERCRL